MSEDKPKTNGNNNLRRGSTFERLVVNDLKSIGYKNVGTSRFYSRALDHAKVDIASTNESKYGRFPYNIQCKTKTTAVDYSKLLLEMPQDGNEVNVIFHKKTKKTEGGTFRKTGAYAILKLEDFYDIMKKQLELEDEVKAWSNIM